MHDPASLDKDAVALLAGEILLALRAHYSRRPTGRETVLEVLNALGITTATVIAGTTPGHSDGDALIFFSRCVANQLSELEPPRTTH